MATTTTTIFLSPSAILSTTTTTTTPPSPCKSLLPFKQPLTNLTAAATIAAILTTAPLPSLAQEFPSYQVYYGTAASAANYGGYGGNSNKKDSAEYVYDVPAGWKERLVSKVEKGTKLTFLPSVSVCIWCQLCYALSI